LRRGTLPHLGDGLFSEPLLLLENVLLQLRYLVGIALVDRFLDLALEVGLRVRERGVHRLRYLDARVARTFPVQPEELGKRNVRAPFTNILLVAGFDLGGVAHI
jgi:hypothetical protein